jgi:L-alanine-DL-glutamate epimerase-like enolase superfamily enzyme
MSKPTDIRVTAATLYFLPIQTRVPLKFGKETLTSVTCARVRVRVVNGTGRSAEGWGETPLSVQWAWPGILSYQSRLGAMKLLCALLARAWADFGASGHPIELGCDFLEEILPGLLGDVQLKTSMDESMPWLAALVCASAFDIAVHDAYGALHGRDIYKLYGGEFMNRDLAEFLEPAQSRPVNFAGQYPANYLVPHPSVDLPAWHLVGGLDPIEPAELTGEEPNDGYPVLLRDWIHRDGLKCLKIKLRGNDAEWDAQRIAAVGRVALAEEVEWLTVDFNCTVQEPEYVNAMLDRLKWEHPLIYSAILYVEQPFPYDIEANQIDVHSVSSRKPLFLDESAHDWRRVRLGFELGWTGVALKTCKTQTGALLSGCWAKAHGMALMVQDLSNPMLAQIPHVRLAANIGTIMGVETNGMQYYPDASREEEHVHPGIYRRRNGRLALHTLTGAGFGYRLSEMKRVLPPSAAEAGG